MLQRKVLVLKGAGAVYTRRPRAVALEKVPALAHEALDLGTASAPSLLSLPRGEGTHDAVELGGLVALRLALGVPRLAGAELAEVLGRLGDGVLEELKGHAAEGCAWPVLVPWLPWERFGRVDVPPRVMSKKTLHGVSLVVPFRQA